MIAPNEYQLAIRTVISGTVEISRQELIVVTARLLGFDRTGPDLKEAVEQQTRKLVKAGKLHQNGNVLQLGADS
jgi:hypothetical protein